VIFVSVNYNGASDTLELVSELSELDYPNYDTIIVENGSSDNSLEELRNSNKTFDLLVNEKNVGYSKGANSGIEYALGKSPDYIMLINNDARPYKGSLIHLVDTIESNENAVAVSGIIRFTNGDIQYAGGDLLPHFTKPNYHSTIQDTQPYETDVFHGAAVLLSASYIELVGGLNEAYFFGMDDTDLSLTINKSGKKIIVDPRVEFLHEGGAVAGMWNPFRIYHSTWNRIYFIDNNLSIATGIIALIHLFVTRIVLLSPFNKLVENRLDFLKYSVLALHDYINGKKPREPNFF